MNLQKLQRELIYLYSLEQTDNHFRVIGKVLSKILEEIRSSSIKSTVIFREEAKLNGSVKRAAILIESSKEKLIKFIGNWNGTINWIGKSEFRKDHAQKEWKIYCQKIIIKDNLKDIFEHEIKFTAIRSSGAGGQHVNKVSTAVRALHIPTGLQVLVSDTRSQAQNKLIAKERLTKLVQNHFLKKMIKQLKTLTLKTDNSNIVRTIYGTDFKSKSVDKSYKSKRKSENQKFWRNLDD